MTYCVGIAVDEGLIFAADTRTNASLDDVRVHSKLHVFEDPGERVFVLMTSGNLATTQLAVARIERDLRTAAARSLRAFKHLFEVVEYVGEVLVESQVKAGAGDQSGSSTQATLVFGGQVAGERPGMYLVYALGNAIMASPETPYLQIGESKYGKPILDRIIRPETRLEDAARCALVSLDSTIRSNLSVGLPVDMALVRTDALRVGERMRLEADTPLYAEIRDTWSRKLENAVRLLPRFPWEEPLPPRAASEAALPPLPARRAPPRQDPGDQSAQQ
jgi:putative proteasome-type protease